MNCNKAPAQGAAEPETSLQKSTTLEGSPQEDAIQEAFFASAKSVLRIFNYLILPTILGLLCSLAFVIREVMKSFSNASFIIGNKRRMKMRIILGPLLGLLSGLLLSPEITGVEEASFSPLLLGFLMGYSVEFAFSLFDKLIEKAKSLLPEIIVTQKANTENFKPSLPVPQIIQIIPPEGAASGGSEVTIIGSGFSQGAKVKFGDALAIVSKVEQSQIVAIAPAGQGSVDVIVITEAGSSPLQATAKYTYSATTNDAGVPAASVPAG